MIEHTLKHIAIIMDGNRRWASERGLPKMMGHNEATKTLKKIITASQKRGISFITLWALSTENLKERSEAELKNLFSLFEKLTDELKELKEKNVRVNIIGDLTKIPASTQTKLNLVQEETKNNTDITVNLGINYGGHDEIMRAIKKIIAKNYKPEDVTEQLIDEHLDTAGMPEVQMIIRTGGDQRLSGFLCWQGIYAQLYFTPTKWPAFDEKELDKSIEWYHQQKINKGK